MRLEIVSHCWQYSRLLNYQLSSLVLHPPTHAEVTLTVFVAHGDQLSQQVVLFFARRADPPRVVVRRWRLPKYQLMRREIGRNQAALTTVADWIWFTDCDYCFGPQAIDSVATALQNVTGSLAFPRQTLVSATHAVGDEIIQRFKNIPCLARLDPGEFVPSTNDCAIGGIQIVRGDVARKSGYLNGSTYLRPARTWQRTFGDVRFRQQLGTEGTPIEIPAIYRILHTKVGRDDPDLRL